MPAPRQLTPEVLAAKRRAWEQSLATRILSYRETDAMWSTRYWSSKGVSIGSFDNLSTDGQEWVEVNSMYAWVTGYKAALYDPQITGIITRGSDLSGDAVKAQKTLNTWVARMNLAGISSDIDDMAIKYDGAAASITIDKAKKDVLASVCVTPVPWWEVVPDMDTTNVDKQRHVARVYFMPLTEARAMFRDPELKGRPKPGDNYLVTTGDTSSAASSSEPTRDQTELVVRVMEVLDFVDPYYVGESIIEMGGVPVPGFEPSDGTEDIPAVLSPDGLEILTPAVPGKPYTPREMGRREWYVLGEGDDNRVRLSLPLPLPAHDDMPLTPIPCLTYMHDGPYPLRGLAMVDRMKPQSREKMIVRSIRSTNVGAQVPQAVAVRGMFDSTAKEQFKRRNFAAILEVDEKYMEGGSLAGKVIAMPQQNVVSDVSIYSNEIEGDINRSTLQGPAQRAQTADVSATQSNQLEETSRSEIAILLNQRNRFYIQVFRAILAAIRAKIMSLGPDAKLVIVEGQGDSERITEVTADDLDGNFNIEIGETSSTQRAMDQKLRRFLDIMTAAKPLMDAVVAKDDPVSSLILDKIVSVAELDREFTSEHLRTLTPAPGEQPQLQNGPGGKTTMVGQGSRPQPNEPTPGGPQPGSEQPVDTQTGTAQNPGQVMAR